MIIRKINPEEFITAEMIETIAFVATSDFDEKLKNPTEHCEGCENVWAAFTDDNVMTSRMTVIPFTMMFDGNEVKMAGIGGVASLPEYRNAGGIRNIFTEVMKEMREKEQVFSYLYPFSHKYYRKFGYEMCYDRRAVKFPLSALKDRNPTGSLTFFKKDDDIKAYTNIYWQFINNKNLSIVRDEKGFKEFINKDPYKTRQYTYLWHNKEDEPKSYITFLGNPRENDLGTQMNIREFAWVDTEGLHGMLSCLGRFDAQYDEVFWEAPDIVDLYSIISEPYDLKVLLQCGGMNRIIDVKKALELIKAPCGEGRAVIAVTDLFLDWNNKSFEIIWGGGQLKVKEALTEPDVTVSVQTLVKLVCGYFTPNTAEMSGQLNIVKNKENLNKLFYKKSLYITDRF